MIEKEYGKHTEHNHNFYCKTVLRKNYFTETNCVNCLLPISTFLVLPGKFALDLLTNCFTDGDRDLVIGTDNGIYLVNQWPIDENIGPQLIIDTVGVTQIDILEEHRLFMILSNGTLSSYPIEVLNASGDQDLVSCEPQKVQDYVDFFKIGISVGRHLVCSVNTSESSTEIRVFQPTDIFNRNGMRLALDSMGWRDGNTLNLFKVSNSFFPLTKLPSKFFFQGISHSCRMLVCTLPAVNFRHWLHKGVQNHQSAYCRYLPTS